MGNLIRTASEIVTETIDSATPDVEPVDRRTIAGCGKGHELLELERRRERRGYTAFCTEVPAGFVIERFKMAVFTDDTSLIGREIYAVHAHLNGVAIFSDRIVYKGTTNVGRNLSTAVRANTPSRLITIVSPLGVNVDWWGAFCGRQF